MVLMVKNEKDAEVLGSGMVVIIDSSNMGQTNIIEAEDKCGLFVENLIVHLLVKGRRFNLETRELANPAINPRKKKDDEYSHHTFTSTYFHACNSSNR